MGGFLPSFGSGAKNDLTRKKNMNAMHRHIEEKADGSKKIIERSLEFSDNQFITGDGWLHNPFNPEEKDKEKDHYREDKSQLIIREKRIEEDAFGNRTIDEFAVKTDDFWSSHGTKLIGNGPAMDFDKRLGLLSDFSLGSNPLDALGSKKDQLYLDEGSKI